jgi:hypothetical protein
MPYKISKNKIIKIDKSNKIIKRSHTKKSASMMDYNKLIVKFYNLKIYFLIESKSISNI